MNDFEQRLRDLGEKAGGDVRGDLVPRPAHLRRIAARRLVVSGSAFVSVALVVVGAAVAWPGGERRPAPIRPADTPPAATPEPPPPTGEPGLVIWPEDTQDEAERGCARAEDRQRTAPAVASAFATEVLGWEAPLYVAPRTRSGPWKVTPSGADLYGGDVDAGVRLWLVEFVPGCWSVNGVSRLGDRRPTGVGISVSGSRVSVAFDPLGAASARIEVGYGDRSAARVWDSTLRDPRLLLDLGFRPQTTGHFLILFEDEEGRVFSASGGALPAGDFAAG